MVQDVPVNHEAVDVECCLPQGDLKAMSVVYKLEPLKGKVVLYYS